MQHAMLIPEIHEFSMLAKKRQRARGRQVAQIRYRYPATATDFATYATSAQFGDSYSQIPLPS